MSALGHKQTFAVNASAGLSNLELRPRQLFPRPATATRAAIDGVEKLAHHLIRGTVIFCPLLSRHSFDFLKGFRTIL